MGMFDRDPNLEDHFKEGDRFVLRGLQYVGKIDTRHGQADKTLMHIVSRDTYPKTIVYSALGVGFANMAQRAERSEFPVVVEFVVLDIGGGKTLKKFAPIAVAPADFVKGEDGPPVDPAFLEVAATGATGGGTAADDDPGF